MKKRILFIYPEMMVGGSTTSLVSLLNAIDYSKMDVDLLLYKARGPLITDIPKQVNLLPQASEYPGSSFFTLLKKVAMMLTKGYLFKAVFAEFKYHKRIGLNNQVMAHGQADLSRELENEYDTAIGFLELWSHAYLTSLVKAKQKIGWIHVDFEKARYIPSLEEGNLNKLDKIVSVSQSCLDSFTKTFPNLTEKSLFMENILSETYIKNKAGGENADALEYEGLKLVTVCRLAIDTKGLDRAVLTAAALKNEGYGFRWYIIGDGSDREKLMKMIKDHGVSDQMKLLGLKLNPYPYIKKCDIFVLPSRYEGKPMSVTEAQILGLPAIITDYASASEQVNDGEDGFIVKNESFDSLHKAIKNVLENPEILKKFKENIAGKKFDFELAIEQFYELISIGA